VSSKTSTHSVNPAHPINSASMATVPSAKIAQIVQSASLPLETAPLVLPDSSPTDRHVTNVHPVNSPQDREHVKHATSPA